MSETGKIQILLGELFSMKRADKRPKKARQQVDKSTCTRRRAKLVSVKKQPSDADKGVEGKPHKSSKEGYPSVLRFRLVRTHRFGRGQAGRLEPNSRRPSDFAEKNPKEKIDFH